MALEILEKIKESRKLGEDFDEHMERVFPVKKAKEKYPDI